MPLDQATRTLQDTAALWSIDAVSPQAVVSCARDALIAGLDSPSLRILAGLTRTEADYHVLDILPAALAELGLDFYPRDSRGGQEAAARALAAQASCAGSTFSASPTGKSSNAGVASTSSACCSSSGSHHNHPPPRRRPDAGRAWRMRRA